MTLPEPAHALADERAGMAGLAGGRLAFIDALRAVACTSVVVYHFYASSALHTAMGRWVPAPLDWLLGKANLGVYVFFVISGFVIAYSLRSAQLTGRFVANFAVRRSIRLDPPYWAAMAVCLVVGGPHARRITGSAVPSPREVFRNVCYLQELTASHRILDVSWTLCYEVQFYIVLVVALALAQRVARGTRLGPAGVALAVTWPASFATLAVPAGWATAVPGLFVNLWYAFYLGALTWWTLSGRVRPAWFWAYGVGVAATLWARWDWAVVGTLATTATIYTVGRRGGLTTLLDWRPVQAVGRASYSVYLVHGFFAVVVLDYGRRRTGDATVPAIGWELLALGLTAAVSWAVYHYVERPATRLAARIKGRPLSSIPLTWPRRSTDAPAVVHTSGADVDGVSLEQPGVVQP